MAWNTQESGGKKEAPKKAKLGRWLATTGLTIAVLAGGAVYFLNHPVTPKADKQEKSRAKIAEAQADLSEAPEVEEAQPVEPPKPLPPQRVGELRDGYRLLPSGRLHKVVGIITNTPPKISIADKTFKHSADVELANLLLVEPGEDLLGDSEGMYDGFEKELAEALSEKIVFEPEDTDFQRELKESVIELRQELEQRQRAGEDIVKLMEDTRNQLKELSLYRQELEDQVTSLTSDELTQADYEDLINAANQMLADRGIMELELPTTLRRALRLKQIQEQALQKEIENEIK